MLEIQFLSSDVSSPLKTKITKNSFNYEERRSVQSSTVREVWSKTIFGQFFTAMQDKVE